MRLICPNCGTQYEVEDNAIPESGRDVQCSDCGHGWFQLRSTATEKLPATPGAPVTATGTDLSPEVPVQRKPLDEKVMAILREEALREVAARRAEAARVADLPSQPGPAAALASFAASGKEVATSTLAQPDPALPDPALPEPALPERALTEPAVLLRPIARRDILPDIEEINSTLTAGHPRRAGSPQRADEDPRRGFRAGFGVMMLLVAVAAAVYALSPRIARMVPESASAMTAYVGMVDDLRRRLDTTVTTAQQGIEGLLFKVE